jgi:hypothetical protein
MADGFMIGCPKTEPGGFAEADDVDGCVQISPSAQ